MSSSAEFESLLNELKTLQDNTRENEFSRSDAMLVMRLVQGISFEHWQELCSSFSLSNWCTLPMPHAGPTGSLSGACPDTQPLLVDGTTQATPAGTLNAEVFSSVLACELLRLSRTGGNLSLLCTSLLKTSISANQERSEQVLVDSLRHCLEPYDSLGSLQNGCFAALLPGMGALKARYLAEKLQMIFRTRAVSSDTGHISDRTHGCAVGIVCVNRDFTKDASRLLSKALTSLEKARYQPAYIHQDTSDLIDERTSLVQSHEKRFLFFGGDKS